MSVNRTTIGRSPGRLTLGGVSLYPERDIDARFAPDWDKIVAWAYGRVDEAKKDLKIPIRTRLWGAYENLPVLFPAAVLNPVPGTSLCSDAALVMHAKNGDQITFHNAFINKLIDLEIAIDKSIWAADLELMCLIKSGANPEDAAAYFTRASGVAFSDTTFAKTNFMRRRCALGWALKTGFTSFEMREGVKIGWKLDTQYDVSGNYGTDNAYIGEDGLIGELRGIPAITDLSTSDAESNLQNTGHELGTLLSSEAADLTATLSGSGSHAIVLKNAGLISFEESMSIKKLRAGEHIWQTTRGFTLGVPAVVATVA
jgi:hypothetical protein